MSYFDFPTWAATLPKLAEKPAPQPMPTPTLDECEQMAAQKPTRNRLMTLSEVVESMNSDPAVRAELDKYNQRKRPGRPAGSKNKPKTD